MQIESMLGGDDPVRTYETRVPVTELPNFKPPRQPLSWGLVAACATTGAAVTGRLATLPVALLCIAFNPCQQNDFAMVCASGRRYRMAPTMLARQSQQCLCPHFLIACACGCAVGAVLFLRQRQLPSGRRAVRGRTAPLSSVGRPGADECPEDEFGGGGRLNPFRASEQAGVADERAAGFKRRESAPAAQGMREMWERAKWVTPYLGLPSPTFGASIVKWEVNSAEEEFSRRLGCPLGMLLEETQLPGH